MKPACSLVVVVPCFNEANRLPLDSLLEWSRRRPDWHWLLVDDGSTDSTLSLLTDLAKKQSNIELLALAANAGKAEAVRQGLLSAQERFDSPWFCFFDADFATPAAEIERLHSLYHSSERLLVLGCRLKRLGARIERTVVRHYLGRIAASLISLLLNLPTYDTQCGAKLIHASLIEVGFRLPFASRWLFDVEVLARCRNFLGVQGMLERTVEEPLLEWAELGGSKLRLRDLVRIPAELWQLHRHYNHKGAVVS